MSDNWSKIIEEDLSEYTQDNLAPKSFTVGTGDNFRHYELGEVFGVVAFSQGNVMFCDIREDDDNWFCFSDTDRHYSAAYWMKTKTLLYNRMIKWLDENCDKLYYHGCEGMVGRECGWSKLKEK